MLVTSANMTKMKDMLKWSREVGASRCSFILMIAFSEELDKTNPQFNDDFGKIIEEAAAYAKDINMEVTLPSPVPSKKNCFEPWRSVRIAIDGNIYPCTFIFESDKAWTEYYKGASLNVNQQEFVMGNIFKDDVASMWNGPRYRALRSKVNVNNCKGSLTPEEFSSLRSRQAQDDAKPFSYCDYCLYRWRCAC
jgi:MoaA/NifB/PqqE/SkfB family radical SAM enzyme